jgi:ABC-type sugar transport system ATPase subunit
MSTLDLDNLTKTFDGTAVLEALSLSVKDGELMVVVGPSGSGKTTLLRLIGGLDAPSSGDIRIGGRSVTGIPSSRRDITMVFQHPALYPHMAVSANIAFPLKMQGVSSGEIAVKVRDAAAALGIAELLGRMPSTLSGGQAQRVMLAKAMVRNPSLCLLDEPVSSLDPALRASARAEVRSLQRKLGTTTIYVTHDQSEAMSLGDRIAVLCEGRLQQVAEPSEVYNRPANRFVASFFGSPAMNFLEGRLDEGCFVSSAEIRVPLGLSGPPAAPGRAVLGIRPDCISLSAGDGQSVRLEVVISGLENLGDRIVVHAASLAGEAVRASVDARSCPSLPSIGAACAMYISPRDVMVFEPGLSGRRLS